MSDQPTTEHTEAVDFEAPDPLEGRHPAVRQVLAHFAFGHLPEPLHSVSRAVHDLAWEMVARIADDPQLTSGLHDLLRAKDCFVRAVRTAGEPAAVSSSSIDQNGEPAC